MTARRPRRKRAAPPDPAPGEERVLLGVVLPPGVTGFSAGGGRAWRLGLRLAPWRTLDGPLVQEELLVERDAGQSVVSQWSRQLPALSVVRLDARWSGPALDPWGLPTGVRPGWTLLGKPALDTSDAELNGAAARLARIEVDAPPFPRLVWDGCQWVGDFPAGLHGERPAVLVATAGSGARPANAQRAAYQRLLDRMDQVRQVVVDAVYERWQAGDLSDPDAKRRSRRVRSSDDLARLLPLEGVHVHDRSRRGEAYVGLSFDCPWDEEHGLGVALHGSRVVAIGSADVALGEFDDRRRPSTGRGARPPGRAWSRPGGRSS